ncbi:MAG: hypothetical protein ABI948_09870 [Thermoleophilia bacterium]
MLDTAGERVSLDSSLSWVSELVAEGAAGELCEPGPSGATVYVRVESSREGFDTQGWELLARGAWRRNGEVVVQNACTAGFDLHVSCSSGHAEFTYRWRPPVRDRVAARVLRSRFHLLARAMLMQYPVFWWAGTRGRAPLHASGCIAGRSKPMLTGASGVGRSTLILRELDSGGRATGDNLAAGDGTTVWGLAEPLRVEGGNGRQMPHGRAEASMPDRLESLQPGSFVVLARAADSQHASLATCGADEAARALVTSTYMAGELRRYWPFAATLSAGTGFGPPHPPVTEVASAFAARLPCFSLALGPKVGPRLSELLEAVEVAA